MHELTRLIQKDMVPALGVTEPGVIAFCVAKEKSYAKGELLHLNVAMNSGMYKNAFTCGIPNFLFLNHQTLVTAARTKGTGVSAKFTARSFCRLRSRRDAPDTFPTRAAHLCPLREASPYPAESWTRS